MFWTLLVIFSLAVTKSKSEEALLLDLLYGDFEDIGDVSDEKCSNLLTACPAFTQQEKEFDEKVSLSGNSLFSRFVYPGEEYVKNIDLDICDKPYKPVMIYNIERDKYEIGYELYHEDSEDINFHSLDEPYDNYRPVRNSKNYPYYEILNQPTPPSDFVTVCEDGPRVGFNFTDGFAVLIFHWRYVFDVKSSGYNKKVSNFVGGPTFTHDQPIKCEGYYLHKQDGNIFSEKTQEIYLKDILAPEAKPNPGFGSKLFCGQSYGCLENAQIIPLQYFDTHAEKIASCSHMNMIPVWKTIADGQLRKVDLFTIALDETINAAEKVFGVSGILRMKKKTGPTEPQELFLSDPEHQKTIPVPKIIYRIIEHIRLRRPNTAEPVKMERIRYAAAIIIHNDPSPVPDTERLCKKESGLVGWDKIINEDSRTGLTYVCPVTAELNEKLGAYDHITSEMFQNLNLNAVPYSSDLTRYDPKDEIIYRDFTDTVEKNFNRVRNAGLI